MPAFLCFRDAQMRLFRFYDLPVKPGLVLRLTRKTGFTGFTGFYTGFTPVLRAVLRVIRVAISGFTGSPPLFIGGNP